LTGSLAFVGVFPWILKYTFRGTQLTLRSLGRVILCPIALSLAGIASAQLALHVIVPRGIVSQLLVSGLGFAAAYALSALLRPVREEVMSLRKLLSELRQSRQAS